MLPATQPLHLRYGFALLAVLVTVLLKLLLSPWISLENACLLFTGAVVVSAWYGGIKAGLFATTTDISQRKQAEMALEESVKEATQSLGMLRMVVSNTPTILYAVNSEGVFTLSEGKGLESLGLKPGELVGKSIFEIYQDNPTIIEYTKRVLAGEEKTWLAEIAGKWFENRSAPLRDEERKIFGLMGIATEITKRKQAEDALQESEERFRQIAENINEVFYLTDLKQLKIMYVSPAYEDIWGRSCQSLYEDSTSFLETIHPEDREHANACFHRKYEGEETQLEYRIIRPDGTMRWIWDRCFLVRNESGEVYRVCGVAEDITERKQAQTALLRVNEELEKRVEVRTAELYRREQEFKALVENSPDMISRLDTQLRHLYVSPVVERVTGIAASAFIGKTISEMGFPEEKNKVWGNGSFTGVGFRTRRDFGI